MHHYEQRYPLTLAAIKADFAARKFCNVSQHDRNKLIEILISENTDILSDAPVVECAVFQNDVQEKSTLSPEKFQALAKEVFFATGDTTELKERLFDYTVRAQRHAVIDKLENLFNWLELEAEAVVVDIPARGNVSYDLVACSQRDEAREYRKAA